MAILQVRDIDDAVYEQLKRVSQQHRRSISQEVIHILEAYLTEPDKTGRNATEEFLKLAGSWKDDRTAEEIVRDMRDARQNSARFSESEGVFD